jgi:polar amino acid transport system substrate-binding protein
MKLFSLSLSALALAFCLAGSAGAASYVNGIDANYPPHAFVGENGKPSGLDVDAMSWIAEKMGFTVTHQPMDWDGIIPALLAKKIDMVCSGMSISPARAEQVNFSEPYFTISKVIIARADSALTVEGVITGSSRLGVQRGTNEHEILETRQEAENLKYELRFYDSGPMAIEDLLNGRLDAVAMDSAPANDAIRHGKAVKILGSFAPDDNFGVAVRKEDGELLRLVNEGFRLLKADPYWQELQARYLQ